MPITDILPMIQAHAWVPLAALAIGFLVRTLKSDAFVLPSWAAVAAPYRPLLVLALGIVSGVLDAVVAGTPWRDAIIGGLLSALMALIGHTAIVDVLRGGRDIGVDDLTPTEPVAPQRPPVTIEMRANIPPSASSDEVTWPKGPPTPRNDRPRGVAQVRVLAFLALLATVPLSPALHLAGCAWLSAKAPVVKRVVKAVSGACTGYAIVVPDVGPVCLVLAQVDQILEDVLAAKRDGVAYHLAVEIDGVERSVTIPPEQLAAFASHVGSVSATGHAAPAASGSAGAR